MLGEFPREPGSEKVFSAAPISFRGSTRHYLTIVLTGQYGDSTTARLRDSYILRLSARNGRIERQMAEIERMARGRHELIANVSHDLRTPIASLRGSLDTLALKDEALSKRERDEYLQIAIRQSERLGRLVDELFELTKLDAHEVEPDIERFKLAELVQDNGQRFQLTAKEKGRRPGGGRGSGVAESSPTGDNEPMWSRETRLMFRPEATFRHLADVSPPPDGASLLFRRPLLLGLLLAAFVSFTTSGRLTLRLLVDGLVCWSFVPAMNLVVARVLAATSAGRLSFRRSVDLLFSAFGPWLCWLLVVAGHSAFVPATVENPGSLRPSWIIPVSFLAALIWSSWIQFRLLDVALGFARLKSLLLLAGFKLAVWGAVVAFFALSDQAEPRLPPWPGS